MNKKQKYKELLLKVFSAEVGAKFFLGLVSLFSIRFMPIHEFSEYAFSLSLFVFLTSVISSVLNIVYLTFDPKQVSSLGSSFFSVQVLALFLLFLILIPLKSFFNGLLSLIFILSLVHCFFLFCQTYFQKELNFKLYYGLEYIRVALFAVLFTLLIFTYESSIKASHMLLIQILATVVPVILVFGQTCNTDALLNFVKINNLFRVLFGSEVKYLFGYFVIVAMLLNVDLFLLKIFSNQESVAEYGAAFRYYAILQVALISVQKLLLPLISQTTDRNEIRDVFKQHRVFSLYLLVLFPLIYLGAVFVIPAIDNGKYPGSVNIFLILALSSYFSFSFSPYSNILIKSKNYAFMFKLIVCGFVMHIILSYLTFSTLGTIGIALSNLFSYGTINYFIYKKSCDLMTKGEW